MARWTPPSPRSRSTSSWTSRRSSPSIAGPEASAGPRRAYRREDDVPQGAARLRGEAEDDRSPRRSSGEASRESFPASDAASLSSPSNDAASSTVGNLGRSSRPSNAGRRARSTARRVRSRPRRAWVIASITSCTNTSNPSSDARRRRCSRRTPSRRARCKPWVKTTMAPGSQVVTDYDDAGRPDGRTWTKLGFHLVGYGCTTCIGNSGPLPQEISDGHQRRATSSVCRCCRATATSRAASTPT